MANVSFRGDCTQSHHTAFIQMLAGPGRRTSLGITRTVDFGVQDLFGNDSSMVDVFCYSLALFDLAGGELRRKDALMLNYGDDFRMAWQNSVILGVVGVTDTQCEARTYVWHGERRVIDGVRKINVRDAGGVPGPLRVAAALSNGCAIVYRTSSEHVITEVILLGNVFCTGALTATKIDLPLAGALAWCAATETNCLLTVHPRSSSQLCGSVFRVWRLGSTDVEQLVEHDANFAPTEVVPLWGGGGYAAHDANTHCLMLGALSHWSVLGIPLYDAEQYAPGAESLIGCTSRGDMVFADNDELDGHGLVRFAMLPSWRTAEHRWRAAEFRALVRTVLLLTLTADQSWDMLPWELVESVVGYLDTLWAT